VKTIPRNVWILSLISLFTDIASEMLYPVIPIYLETIGFSILLIGILEGIAEATTGLSKGYFGKLSDRLGRRVPFIKIGYSLSAISKPLLAISSLTIWVFIARTLDRLGKGIRTGARDALLSELATFQTKGKIFGFHRSLDSFGAVLGPVLSIIYLNYFPLDYKTLFLIAFIPGVIAISLSLFLNEKHRLQKKTRIKYSFFSFIRYWNESSKEYKKVVSGLLIFALFNSSDVFLLLKAKQSGLDDRVIIGIYVFYNFIYALFAFPIGVLSDKIGIRKIFIIGLFLFSIVYSGMAFSSELLLFLILFFIYGLYSASTEGIAKAWISNIVKKEDTATAIGTFSAFQSVCSMIASWITGFIWFLFDSTIAFVLIAFITILIICYFIFTTTEINSKELGI
jgi:MFS family permease